MRRARTGRRRADLCLLFLAVLQGGCVSWLIYFPDRVIRITPEQLAPAARWVAFEAEDGVRLTAWYVPQEPAHGTVLFLHGNGGNVSHYTDALALFGSLGYSSFALDYRGYGESAGRPSEQGTYRDAEAAWRHLVDVMGVPPSDIVIFGRSLGGAIAAWLAGKHSPRLLVLQSAFTSLADAAATLYPWAPARLLVGDRYDTQAFLREVQCPVLVIHSPDDEIVPYADGRRLFELARPPKRFLEIQGRHNSARYDQLTADHLDPATW
jgi:pimeloyl-ACP methyl ester carboxylesterase